MTDTLADTIVWHRAASILPTADRGAQVLTHSTEWDETRIVRVATVRDHPDRFDWWAELPRPPRTEGGR